MRGDRDRLNYLLDELGAELQELGTGRGDWGCGGDDVDFNAETLTTCLRYLARRKDAPKELLFYAALELLEEFIRRERLPSRPSVTGSTRFGGKTEADEKNEEGFRKLVDEFKQSFVTSKSDP